MRKKSLFLLSALASCMLSSVCMAQETLPQQTDSTVQTREKRTVIQSIIHYFGDANKRPPTRKPDFSFIGGPHYSSDTKLGLGLVGAGVYTTDENDPNLMTSNVSVYGDICTVGFWLIGVRGNHIFPQDKRRIDYSVYFYDFPATYWGIGFKNCDNDDNAMYFKRFQMQAKASFQWRLAKNLYAGPLAVYDLVRGKNPTNPELLNGQPLKLNHQGLGFSIALDTRDVMTNAHKGVYLKLEQIFRPKFLGNDYAFSTTDFNGAVYKRLWKSAVWATNLKATFNVGNPPWALMALFASSSSMRGYYEGRYRDKDKFEFQTELRQHVWRRVGVVAWGGVGTVFHNIHGLKIKNLLPNCGLGARWEFKKDMNVRLDYGFGRHGQSAFMFQMNEAF